MSVTDQAVHDFLLLLLFQKDLTHSSWQPQLESDSKVRNNTSMQSRQAQVGVRDPQKHDFQQNLFSAMASQDSLQLGANTLLFMANVSANGNANNLSATSQSSAFQMSQSSNITASQLPADGEIDQNMVNYNDNGLHGAQRLQTNEREYGFNDFNNLSRSNYTSRARDSWLPRDASEPNHSLDHSATPTKVVSVTPSSKILPMDRPSHWGSKPKGPVRPDKKTLKSREFSKNKKSKSEIVGFDFGERSLQGRLKSESVVAGMIIQFPLKQISLDAGNLDVMSFRPAWLKAVSPKKNVPHDVSSISRGGVNEDDIQDAGGVLGSDNRPGPLSTTDSSQAPSQLLMQYSDSSDRIGGRRSDRNDDRKRDSLSDCQITRQQVDWRSPGSSGKLLKNGSKIRAKAGSLKAIYQKLVRSVEEKECRMLNIEGSASDPQDPRNRSAFSVDLRVTDDYEEWPFRVVSCVVVDCEVKAARHGYKREASRKLFDPAPLGLCESYKENEEGEREEGHSSIMAGQNSYALLNGSHDKSNHHDDYLGQYPADSSSSSSMALIRSSEINSQNSYIPTKHLDGPGIEGTGSSHSNHEPSWMDPESMHFEHPQGVMRSGDRESDNAMMSNTHGSSSSSSSSLLGIEMRPPDTFMSVDTNRSTSDGRDTEGIVGCAGLAVTSSTESAYSVFQKGVLVRAYFKATNFQRIRGRGRALLDGSVIRVFDPEVLHTLDCAAVRAISHDLPNRSSADTCRETNGRCDDGAVHGAHSAVTPLSRVNEMMTTRHSGRTDQSLMHISGVALEVEDATATYPPLAPCNQQSHVLSLICTELHEMIL